MSFRDDREAAHLKAAALEEELSEVKAELARVRAGDGGRARRRAAVAIAVAAVTLASGALAFLLVRVPSPPPRPTETLRASPPPAPQPPPPTPPTPPLEPAPTPPPVVPPTATRDEPVADSVELVWRAEAVDVAGVRVPVGAQCEVRGTFHPYSDARHRRASRINPFVVRCGDRVLYDPTQSIGSGISMSDSHADETLAADGRSFEYALVYRDEGARTGPRAQVGIDTVNRRGRVWRDGASAMHVDLRIRDVSAPRQGAGIYREGASAFAARVIPAARVTSVTGSDAPVARGARCMVTVRPAITDSAANCRVVVRCANGPWIYGASDTGYARCTIENGAVTAIDGSTHPDDQLALSWSGNVLTITADDASGSWSTTLSAGPLATTPPTATPAHDR
ncbi:MAG: hypothetical protein U0326_36005 [Polyangiales bacterium]